MDARQLRYFLAIVDQGGFGRAADSLLVAQPSLSQAVAGLERELGVDLFHRVGRRAVLSPAGEELGGHARVVLRDLDAARSAMDAVRGLRSGRVDLITMPSPGIEPLTSMIATFTVAHPGVSLNVDGAFTPDEVIAAVRSGASEIGVLGTASPMRIAGVRSIQLEEQPLMLIVNPRDDTFAPGTTVGQEQLAGCRLVVSQRGSLMRWMVDDVLASGVDVRIVVEVAHRTSILPLVLSGVGHAVMPSSWEPLAAQAGLRTLRIEPASTLHVAVISRTKHLTAAAASFLEVADEYATHSKT
jgi:DNA-binding transcriptional LysR family regulator